jgi:hypothetical protein
MRHAQTLYLQNLKVANHEWDLDVNGEIILKYILEQEIFTMLNVLELGSRAAILSARMIYATTLSLSRLCKVE